MALNTGFFVADMEGTVARMNYCLLCWGLKADLPVAGNAGRLFYATDDQTLYYDDGASFTPLSTTPSGTIAIWSGTIANIPAGWVLCDGVSSAYDLTDKFVIHADGTTNLVGDLGGENSHVLASSEMPSHTHAMDADQAVGAIASIMRRGSNANYGPDSTTAAGGGAAHENRPNYIALAYIEKT